MNDRDWLMPLLRQVSEAAQGYESRWTLRALKRVDQALYQRFEEQRADFDRAVITGSRADAEEHGGGMIRGWQAITRSMEASGEADDAYLLGMAPNGLKVAIGDQKAATARVRSLHGDKVVWMTPDEVAAIIAGQQLLASVKQVWPDAETIDLHPNLEAKAR
jgi:hypothetical protein